MSPFDIALHVIHDAALLFGLTFLFGLSRTFEGKRSPTLLMLLRGLLFGVGGILLMINPLVAAPGIFLDFRLVVVAIAALEVGLLPASTAAVLIIAFRISLGGVGTAAGVASTLTALVLGYALRRWLATRQQNVTPAALVGLGLVVATQVVLWGPLFPQEAQTVSREALLRVLMPTYLLLYPPMLLLLGWLLRWQEKQARLASTLAVSEARYRTIVEGVGDGIAQFDRNGRYTFSNKPFADLVGKRPEEIAGKMIESLMPATSGAVTQEFLDERMAMFKSGRNEKFEFVLPTSAGGSRTLLISDVALRDRFGGYDGGLVITTDVTALRASQAQALALAAAEQRADILRDFVRSMSHDFRTPLSVISTNCYLIERTPDPQRRSERLRLVEAQVKHLERMLTDFSEVMQLEDGRTYAFEAVELRGIIDPVLEEMKQEAAARKHHLSFEVEAMLPLVRADRMALARAIAVLVENAIMYTPDEGEICVSARADANGVLIAVTDTGIGISQADQAHIFDEFFRADRARSTSTGGAGLGLTIARKIIEAHQGVLEVKSEAGEGTTFRIWLPIA
jgi:PAS domain S-box-containing protein